MLSGQRRSSPPHRPLCIPPPALPGAQYREGRLSGGDVELVVEEGATAGRERGCGRRLCSRRKTATSIYLTEQILKTFPVFTQMSIQHTHMSPGRNPTEASWTGRLNFCDVVHNRHQVREIISQKSTSTLPVKGFGSQSLNEFISEVESSPASVSEPPWHANSLIRRTCISI